jgi:hypothetical protein
MASAVAHIALREARGNRVARVGVVVAALVVVAQITAQLVDFWVFDLRIATLDSSRGSAVFDRIGTFAILACALATFAVARLRGEWLPALLAILVSWLFVDELLDLHDRTPHWALIYLPQLAALFAGFWMLSKSFAASPRALVRWGLIVLAVSAVIHLAGASVVSRLGWGPGDWEYQVKVALKEATKVGGWLLLAGGLAAAAAQPYAARR